MDIHQEMSDLLSTCAWVKRAEDALRWVPALGIEMPVLIRVPGQRHLSIPLADGDELVETVVRTLVAASSRVFSGGMGDRVDQLTPEALSADPLVQCLCRNFADLGRPGLRRDAVPVLAVCWISARVLGGRIGDLELQEQSLIRQSEKLASRLQSMGAQEQGEALAGLCWELSGRMGAALSLSQQSYRSLAASGLSRTILPSRLLMSFARGTLDANLDLPLVSAVLGMGLDTSLLERLERVSQLAIQSVDERLTNGRAKGVDFTLEQLLGSRLRPEQALEVLLHPEAGPLLVASIPQLMTTKSLKKAGFSKALVQGFQDVTRMGSLAASWRELCAELARWDTLSTVVERICLLRFKEGVWVSGRRALDEPVRWSCLLPRFNAERPLNAVAVRFTDIRDNVETRAHDTGRNGAPGVVENAWATFCESRSVSVHDWVGDHGIAVFDSPLSALGFAREAAEAFSGPYELPIGTRGGTVAIRQGLRVGVGLSHGRLTGGTDGRVSRLEGPIVSTSMALSGTGMLDGAAEETGGYRRAVNGRTGLRSEGLVLCPEFLEALCASHEAAGVTIRGPTVPGGDGRGFEFFPVLCWWESMTGAVVAMGLGGGQRGGTAAELVDLDVEEFQAFCDADRVAGRMQRSHQVLEGASWEQLGGKETEQRTDDIDAVFLGRPEEPPVVSEPPIFAPDPIAVVARGDSVSEGDVGIVSAPMMIEPVVDEVVTREAEQPGPAVFIDDDWDEGGWEENSWEDESWAEMAGGSQSVVSAPEPRVLQASLQELRESFVIVRSAAGSFFFGKLDGPSLKDAHQCDTEGDLVAAYKSLLVHHQEQRRGERRSQILGIQEDWVPESLDGALLERAVVELDW